MFFSCINDFSSDKSHVTELERPGLDPLTAVLLMFRVQYELESTYVIDNNVTLVGSSPDSEADCRLS